MGLRLPFNEIKQNKSIVLNQDGMRRLDSNYAFAKA